MALNKEKKVTELDFNTIRENLQTYLEGESQFADYDFNGSGLSILLDILAYNTHYSAFYANMVATEMFMDSATKNESVVSHAKQIAYVPHSRKAAEATVTLTYNTATSDDTITLPARTLFTARVGDTNYSFYNQEAVVVGATGSAPYTSDTFSIYEGQWNSVSYIASSTNDVRYVIPSTTVDTDHMKVRVLASATDSAGSSENWTKVTDITGLTASTRSYYLNQNSSGLYELTFGDNILGKKVDDGNLIVIEYFETGGPLSNGIGRTDSSTNRVFSTSVDNTEVAVQSSAVGGAAIETTESIKQNAPLFYQTQDRAVTKDDYKALTLNQYGNADDVVVFGGEDFDPPRYGKVFVSVKPSGGGVLTEDQKQDILRDIYKDKSVVGVIPEIIDPEYTYLLFDAKFNFDPSLTTRSSSDLAGILTTYLGLYTSTELSKFGKNLYVNRLEENCRNLEPSLLYVDVDVKMEKRVAPVLNKKQNYTINFYNTILNTSHDARDGYNGPPSVQSTNFAYKKTDGSIFLAAIDSDMDGNLRIYEIVDNNKQTVFDDIGSINFENGTVTINDFTPLSATEDGTIRFTATPREDVVLTATNNILSFDGTTNNSIVVNHSPDATVSPKDVSTGGY